MGVQSRSTRVTDGLSRRGFLAASAAAGVAAAELGRLSDTESAMAQGDAPTVLLDTVSATVITPDDAAFVYTGAHIRGSGTSLIASLASAADGRRQRFRSFTRARRLNYS